jgi:hypothetical protein
MCLGKAKGWICQWDATPDFKQIVEKSLALFGVFTGVSLSFYVKSFLFETTPSGFEKFPFWSRVLIAVAAISLLLRYIVGSAVHLNVTYVAKVTTRIERKDDEDDKWIFVEEKKDPKSNSLGWLFFDTVMLVSFGLFAVMITYSLDFEQFLHSAVYFILVGLFWSVVAYIWRSEDRAIAERWLAIGLVQLFITVVLIVTPVNDLIKTVVLAPVYVLFLFLDLCVVSRPPPN